MNLTEATALLAVCSAFDNREANEAAAYAWQAALANTSFEDAKDAVVEHYRNETTWIMPAHVRERVRIAGNLRWEKHQTEQLALQNQAYREILALESGGEPAEPREPYVRQKVAGAPVMAFADAMADMDQMIRKSAETQAVPESPAPEVPVVGES